MHFPKFDIFPKMKTFLGKLYLFLGKCGRFWEKHNVFGEFLMFLGTFLGERRSSMRKKNYKGRCEKRKLAKCNEVVRTYDEVQYAYADLLERNNIVKSYQCNVLLEGVEEDAYTTDFLCVRTDGDLMVRECVRRTLISKPMTVRLLDVSRSYWINRGVTDWGIVTNEEK